MTLNYDQSIVRKTIEAYEQWCKQKEAESGAHKTLRGYIAENLVDYAFGQPINLTPGKIDPGYDLIVDGFKIDVKNKSCNIYEYGYWSVANYKKHQADYYYFTKLDEKKCMIDMTGWLTRDEVEKMGKPFKKGQMIPELGCVSTSDVLLINEC